MSISLNSVLNLKSTRGINFKARPNVSMERCFKETTNGNETEKILRNKLKTGNPYTFFSADAFNPCGKAGFNHGESYYNNIIPYVSMFDDKGKEHKEYILNAYSKGIFDWIPRERLAGQEYPPMSGKIIPDLSYEEVSTAIKQWASMPTFNQDVRDAEDRLFKTVKKEIGDDAWNELTKYYLIDAKDREMREKFDLKE